MEPFIEGITGERAGGREAHIVDVRACMNCPAEKPASTCYGASKWSHKMRAAGGEDWEGYCSRMEHPSAWGGEPEMVMAVNVVRR